MSAPRGKRQKADGANGQPPNYPPYPGQQPFSGKQRPPAYPSQYAMTQSTYMAWQRRQASSSSIASTYGWQTAQALGALGPMTLASGADSSGPPYGGYGRGTLPRSSAGTPPPRGNSWGQQPSQAQTQQLWQGYRPLHMAYPVGQPPNLPQNPQHKIWGSHGGPSHMGGRPRSEMGFMQASVSEGDMYEDLKSKGPEKDKGRGSYRCGRCGAPKKGHICPYQPRFKRRPDAPPPELRNAAVQAEMDEFMTLRRLNIELQGLAQSYADVSFIDENMVASEAHRGVGLPPHHPPPPPPEVTPENRSVHSSPRASPLGESRG